MNTQLENRIENLELIIQMLSERIKVLEKRLNDFNTK